MGRRGSKQICWIDTRLWARLRQWRAEKRTYGQIARDLHLTRGQVAGAVRRYVNLPARREAHGDHA